MTVTNRSVTSTGATITATLQRAIRRGPTDTGNSGTKYGSAKVERAAGTARIISRVVHSGFSSPTPAGFTTAQTGTRYNLVMVTHNDGAFVPTLLAGGAIVFNYVDCNFHFAGGGDDDSRGCAWATANANESWFTHTGTPATSANRLASVELGQPGSVAKPLMNLGSAGYRNAVESWILTHTIPVNIPATITGFWLDEITSPLTYKTPSYPVEYPNEAAWQAVQLSFYQDICDRLRAAGYRSILNVGVDFNTPGYYDSLLDLSDGVQQESWMDGGAGPAQQEVWFPDKYAGLISAESKKKIFIATTYDQTQAGKRYALAAMLMGTANTGWASFCVSDDKDNYATETNFPEYVTAAALGAPLGASFTTGGCMKRNFVNGTVLVNHTSTTGTAIPLGRGYSGSGLTNVSAVTLGTFSGLILLADPVLVSDTGATITSTVTGTHTVLRTMSDTGATITSSVARSHPITITDTGVTTGSSSTTSIIATRTESDTGATITDSVKIGGAIVRTVASTGATITSSVTVSSSSHTFPRGVSETFTFTDSVKRLVRPTGLIDRGVTIIDSALRGQKLQPGVTQSTPGVYEIGLSFVDAGIDTVEITPLVDDTQGRIRIFIQAPSNAATVTVTRTHPSNTSVTVRGMTNAPISSNIFLGYDYEAPIGRELRYQATAYDALGVPVGSSSIETISWDTNDTWIKDPLNPSRNIRILMADPGEEAFDAPTGLNTVLGRPTPIVVTEVRQAATGTLNVLTLTDSDAGTLHLLTSTGNILLVQTSPAYGLGNLYFALQKIAAGRVTPLGFLPERSWGLQYVETDAPVGVATGGDTTWQLVLVGYATWNSLLNTESSWLDLLENINTLSGPPAAPTLAWRGA